MIKIARFEFNLQDDVIFNKIAAVLYAQGCKWGCRGCHSKDLWPFEDGYTITPKEVIDRIEFMNLEPKDVTLVGQGGDFWFQLDNWIQFCKEIKNRAPNIKIFWQTGAAKEMIRDKIIKDNSIFPFDAIAAERPFADKLEGDNRKYLFIQIDNKIAEGWEVLW